MRLHSCRSSLPDGTEKMIARSTRLFDAAMDLLHSGMRSSAISATSPIKGRPNFLPSELYSSVSCSSFSSEVPDNARVEVINTSGENTREEIKAGIPMTDKLTTQSLNYAKRTQARSSQDGYAAEPPFLYSAAIPSQCCMPKAGPSP